MKGGVAVGGTSAEVVGGVPSGVVVVQGLAREAGAPMVS